MGKAPTIERATLLAATIAEDEYTERNSNEEVPFSPIAGAEITTVYLEFFPNLRSARPMMYAL